MPDLIFFKDRDGRYRSCNAAFAQLVGRPKEGIEGLSEYDLFPEDEAAFFVAQDE